MTKALPQATLHASAGRRRRAAAERGEEGERKGRAGRGGRERLRREIS